MVRIERAEEVWLHRYRLPYLSLHSTPYHVRSLLSQLSFDTPIPVTSKRPFRLELRSQEWTIFLQTFWSEDLPCLRCLRNGSSWGFHSRERKYRSGGGRLVHLGRGETGDTREVVIDFPTEQISLQGPQVSKPGNSMWKMVWPSLTYFRYGADLEDSGDQCQVSYWKPQALSRGYFITLGMYFEFNTEN